MKPLNKLVTTKYLYVKNGVIFKISFKDNGDACVVELNADITPSIKVGGTSLYFDEYIEDGDTYTPTNGIKKVIHSTSGEDDKEMTFQEYYKALCEEVIAETIIVNYALTYDDFINDLGKLCVPTWILVQDPKHTTVEGISKINFTEDYYNEVKEAEVKKLALKSASNTTNYYGYELLTTDIDIRKNED